MDKNNIRPRVPGGFRDLLPEEFAKRQWILDKAEQVYKSFGFQQLETSCVEYFETLAGSDETSKQIYRIFNQQPDFSGESMALRFDLTVSLARILAEYRSKINLPFKRYQIGYVWRGERQQKGRYKQFLQFDADIIGASGPSADAEIVIIIDRVMKALGLKDYTIRINNRKILNGFIQSLGLTGEDVNAFLRILDKLDKIEWEGVAEKLRAPRSANDENEKAGLGLDENKVELVKAALIDNEINGQMFSKILKNYKFDSSSIEQGENEIYRLLELAKTAGVCEFNLKFDTSLARGLDYYSGPVFETILNDLPDIGSVMSGGRYDNLMERFGKESYPATGISLGVDRLAAALEEMGLMELASNPVEVLFAPMDNEAENTCFKLAGELRDNGVTCEVFLGDNQKLKKQLNYADRRGIAQCVIIGSEEILSGTAQIKNLKTGEQRGCPILKIVETIIE